MRIVSLIFTLFPFASCSHMNQGSSGFYGSDQMSIAAIAQRMRALEGLSFFPHTRARFLEYQHRRPSSQFFYKIDIHDSPTYRFNQYVLDKDGLKRINEDTIGRVQSSTLKEPEDWTTVAPEMKRIHPAYGKQLNDEQNRRKALPDYKKLFESIASSTVKSPEE